MFDLPLGGAGKIAVFASIMAAAISFLITKRICNPASKLHVLDYPNDRSLHTQPVPRTGGIAILSGILTGTILFIVLGGSKADFIWVGFSVLIIAGVSFIDDMRKLSIAIRFLGQFISASIVVAGGFTITNLQLPFTNWELTFLVSTGFSILFLLWMINLYNFMDGIDGLAAGMAFIGFGTFAVFGAMSGNPNFMIINSIIATASAGFLVFNFPPARLFMGDIGSTTLGLLAACMSLWAVRENIFPFWIAILVFSPFIVDTTVTLIRRLILRQKIWCAHKTHFYQRLVQSGWSHRKTVIYEYVMMIGVCTSALIAVQLEPIEQLALIGSWIVIYICLGLGIKHIEKGYKNAN